ncbi:hypothetical protein ABT187_37815 [Streptomyces sp. NPDC001817]
MSPAPRCRRSRRTDGWLRGTEVVELMATVLFEAEKWPLDNT